MTDEQLAQYIPHHGDRLALVNFIKYPTKTTNRKKNLLDRLRKKVQSKYGSKRSDESESDSDGINKSQRSRRRKLKGNDNARKEFRRIDIGWIIKDENGSKQVRTRQGGGTRKISMRRSATKDDILKEALRLFFKDGVSQKGSKDEYEFDIWDFEEVPLKPNVTLADIYESSKLGILRVYLAATPKKCDETRKSDTNSITNIIEAAAQAASINFSDVDDLPDPFLDNVDSMESSSTIQFGPFSPGTTDLDATIPLSVSEENDISDDIYVISPSSVKAPGEESAVSASIADVLPTIQAPTRRQSNTGTQNSSLQTLSPIQRSFSLQNLTNQQCRTIILHEGNILKELIAYFKDSDIVKEDIIVKRAGRQANSEFEAGDGVGMIRDVLSEFWAEFYEQCTTGYTFKIPTTRHDMQEEEWKSVARILTKGYINYGYFPISLAPTFVEECIYDKHVSSILEVFFHYLTPSESSTLKSACESFESVNQADLFDVLDNHHGRVTLTKENATAICLEIANKELLQDPRFVVDTWKDILKGLRDELPFEQLQQIYIAAEPTTKHILSVMKFPDVVSEGQVATIKYMKQLIKEMDQGMLKSFLRFCTGSDLLVKDIVEIQVEFQHMEGISRRPIAHTCGCVLKLSDNYLNYPDFRSEFNHVLRSGVWLMDII